MKKCCNIRSEKNTKCPFGLPINTACKNVGMAVKIMGAIENEDDELRNANLKIYLYYKNGKECPFAVNIMDNGAVNCNFDDSASGFKNPLFEGSSLYPQTFTGINVDNLYGYPLGFSNEGDVSRNIPYGILSLVGTTNNFELIKNSVSDEIFNKISKDGDLSGDEIDQLKTILEEYIE